MIRRLALIIFVLFLALSYGYFTDNLILSSVFGVAFGGYMALLDWQLENYSARTLLGAGLGLTVGVLLAVISLSAFLRTPLEFPDPFVLAVLGSAVYFGVLIGVNVASRWPSPSSESPTRTSSETIVRDDSQEFHPKVLDTSVIIDGRVAEILEIGFLEGTMIVPRFILKELQNMADSGQNLKRNRGRRGLNILNKIRDDLPIPVEIVERDYPEIPDVDAKLVELAQDMDAKILTNDFNLNKVASLQDVQVLNINDLSNAVKPVYIPGESFEIEVIKEGEEQQQGVGYLEDGTMVVIENALNHIGETIPVTVTSVIQTSAGRMIFAEKGKENALD